jgi:hypothetical protein
VRWKVFDSGGRGEWRAYVGGQDGTPGNGFDELQNGINAWNGAPGTNIRYHYAGTTTDTNGFLPRNGDGQNTVLWNDPNSEIDGTFSCDTPGSGSGTLAIGGPYSTDSGEIVEADIITNDGIACWLNGDGARLSQVLGHELGHTLGLGHSCGDKASGPCDTHDKDDALMRANAHNDDRGARLGVDDIAGIQTLYPSGGGGGGGSKPAAPTSLATSELTSSSVRLTWVDNAGNETSYRVEQSNGGGAFSEIKVLTANAVTTVITGLSGNTSYSFRVRARNGSGNSSYSNTVTVTTLSAAPAAPTKLVATPLSATSVRLDWVDNANNETGFGVEATSPSSAGFASVGAVVAANLTSTVIAGLAADTPYTFRVRAFGTSGNSGYSNEASASTTGAGGPCVAGGGTLCLTGGRFRVRAQWRTKTGTQGIGTAVPYSGGDQSGAFWFFDPANIELLVKVLDGTSSNGNFWVFYGALSDVQYWITVEDTLLGHSATYHNPQGSICGGADTHALPASAGASGRWVELPTETEGGFVAENAKALPSCVPDATTLCLLGGRFQAKVAFTSTFKSGDGQAVPLPADTSGLFWFFDASNVELAVKVIDGRPLNGKFWLFYGALTDVQYDLTVIDTVTSAQRVYHNALHNLCGKGDTTAFTP